MPEGAIQGVLSITTLTKVVDTDSLGSIVINQITLCNQNATEVKFRLAIVTGSDTVSQENYVYYDAPIPTNGTMPLRTSPLKLKGQQEVWLYVNSANVSYQIDTP